MESLVEAASVTLTLESFKTIKARIVCRNRGVKRFS